MRPAFPLDAQPYLFRGRFLEVQSDTKEAADAYREGLKRESSRRDLQVSLARCLISLHDHSAATEILNRLESQAPDDPEVLQNLALGLVQQGELDEATRVLSRLLAVEPKNAVGRLTLGRIHLQNKRHDQAQELLGELAAERPYDIEVRYSNAQALLATGKKEQAAKEFQFVTTARESIGSVRRMMDHVSQKDPMNYELRYQIGASLLRYESPSAGAGWLRSVLEINPNHSPTHEALADYYTQTENTELARFHRDRLRELSTSVTTPPGPTAHQ